MTDAWAELAAICERARHDDDPAGATMSELRTLATPSVIMDLIQRASDADSLVVQHATEAASWRALFEGTQKQAGDLALECATLRRERDEAAELFARTSTNLGEARRELRQARADSQIDGRAMRMLLGLPEDASAQAIVDALMGVVSEAALWRAIGTADHVTFVETRQPDRRVMLGMSRQHHEETLLPRGGYQEGHDPRDGLIIHVLEYGVTRCMTLSISEVWLPNHRWVRASEAELATCDACKETR